MKKLFYALSLLLSICCLRGAEITIFPADFHNNNFSLNAGNTMAMLFTFKGDGVKMAAEKTVLQITAAPGLEVVGATPVHPNFVAAFKINKNLDVFTVELGDTYLKRMVRNTPPWFPGTAIYFRAAENAAGKNMSVKFELKSNTQVYAAKRVTFNIIPKLVFGKKLKNLKIGHTSFHSAFAPAEYEELFQNNLAFWKNLCERPASSLSGMCLMMSPERIKQVLKEFDNVFFMHCVADTPVVVGTPYGFFDKHHALSRPGVRKMLDGKGNVVRGAICPTWLLENNAETDLFWNKHIPEGLKGYLSKAPGIDRVAIDYESFPDAAICDSCRASFAKWAKLKTVPSVKEVNAGGALHMKWRYFRGHTRNQIIKKLADSIHRHLPGVKLVMCTVILREDWVNGWSATDVRTMDKYVDMFFNMHYSSGKSFFDGLKYNIAELKKPNEILIDPAERDQRYYNRYTPAKVRQNIFATYALGCRSIVLYPIDFYDGSYLTMLAETCGAAAEAEKAYLNGMVKGQLKTKILNVVQQTLSDGKTSKTINVPDFSGLFEAFLHKDGDDAYVTLFNFSETGSIIAEVAIPEFAGKEATAVELLTKSEYAGVDAAKVRSGFMVEIPANGVALIKIGKQAKAASTISVRQLEHKLAELRKAQNKEAQFYKPVVKGNRSIAYILHKNAPAVRLKDCNASVCVNPAQSGKISSWYVVAYGDVIGTPKEKCIGELIMRHYSNHLPTPIPFTLVSRNFVDGGTRITMDYTVQPDIDAGGSGNPLEGLKITKEVFLKNYIGNLRVTYRFTNNGKKDMKLGFRLKNVPIYRWKRASLKQIMLSDKTCIGGGTHSYVLKGQPIDWDNLKDGKELTDLTIHQLISSIAFRYTFPGFTGLYFWGSDRLQTVEPVAPDFVLKPGESREFSMDIDRVNSPK